MKFILAFIFSILIIDVSQARSFPSGYEKGNGGFAIVCTEGDKGVFSLDRIEGRILYSFNPSPALLLLKDEVKILNYVLTKLEVVNPNRATLYAAWLEEILKNRKFIENGSIVPISDQGKAIVPVGCTAQQAAIFMTDYAHNKAVHYFDRSLWDQMNALDKAYLLLHEIIYREAQLEENRHSNSMASRYLNAWIFANIDSLNPENVLDILYKLRFKRTDYRGIPLILTRGLVNGGTSSAPIDFFENSAKVRKAILYPSFSIKIGETFFSRVCESPSVSRVFTEYAEFYESGAVKTIAFARDSDPSCGLFNGFNTLRFDENGNFLKGEYIDHPYIF